MKKLFIFSLFFLLASRPVFAQSVTSNPSLSDEVYADLALRGYLNNVSISLYDGSKNDAIALNDDKHWIPASTVKLFAAMYAYKQIATHTLHGYDYMTASGKNVVSTELVADGLPSIQEGDSLTVDRLLAQMVTQSDNTAFNMLLDVLDRKAITEYMNSLGLTHSAVGSKLNLDTSQEQYEFDVPGYGINTTTAQDYTKAFTLILQNKIPGAKSLLAILKEQKINSMLPRLLPKNIIVAHKHGDLDPLYHDGGIIFAHDSPYVVSIFSNVGDPNLVAHLSELIYSRDPKLVGTSIQNSTPLSFEDQSIDPLVAASDVSQSRVLAAQSQPLQTQPITAADLGITAKDLSLAQPTTTLPRIIIRADSPWYFLVPLRQAIKKSFVLTTKAKTQVDVETMLLQVAEAKDLAKRGKQQQANIILQNIQQKMDTVAKDTSIKNDAQTQITLQAISEVRFQILGDVLKTTPETKRNALIREIGQQAKNTLAHVQPNIPLATNATNLTQKPLIGEVIDKTDTAVVVKTAGGQQITIPLTSQSLTVKTKGITPAEKPTLASVKVGTTIALVGSSVGNTFTPTFVLTNVPKELAAPEPVTVLKVNQKNHTMVISENGVAVQVNASNKTIIKGSDTTIGFNQIKPGDVVVVHGEPLTPVAPIKNVVSPTPSKPIVSITPHAKTSTAPESKTETKSTPSLETSPAQNQKPQTLPSVNSSSSLPTKTAELQTKTQNSNSQTVTATPVHAPVAPSSSPKTVQPQSQPQSQPKVIQSTSIRIIEKKEDAAKTQQAPPSQSKPEEKPKESVHEEPKTQPKQSPHEESKSQQPAVQPTSPTKSKNEEKK